MKEYQNRKEIMKNVLLNIKPRYENRVKYSKPDEPLLEAPDSQAFNDSGFAPGHVRPINMEQNAKRGRELRSVFDRK
jgi:hypothetical protein